MTAPEQPDVISIADYLAEKEASEVKHESLDVTVHAMAGATNHATPLR